MAKHRICTPPPSQRRAPTAALLVTDAQRDPRSLIEARRENGPGSPAIIAAVKRLTWGTKGASLTTGFMDNPSVELQREILRHLNMWNAKANVKFVASSVNPQVRIARLTDPAWSGYWSYLGKEILGIPADEPTMNLEGFTMRTAPSEFMRVVCHEAGHTLGFPHEHMRREFVQRIVPKKAYAYFARTDGWTKKDVDEQVLETLDNSTIFSTPPDQTSIMCYQLPGEIMIDAKPILGGDRINNTDHAFAAMIYPKPAVANQAAKKPAKSATKTAANEPAKAATKKTAGKATTPTSKPGAKKAVKRAPAKSAKVTRKPA